MSTNICLIQIESAQLAAFLDQPARLPEFVLEFAPGCQTPFGEKLDQPVDQTFSIDEFTRGLLTDTKTTSSPLEPIHRAIMNPAHLMRGIGMDYGVFAYHTADEVQALADSLNRLAEDALAAPLQDWLALMRKSYVRADYQFLRTYFQLVKLEGAEELEPGAAVRNFQRASFARLQQFFEQAARQEMAVLVIIE